MPPPGTICILRLSAIGDTCHALAVVRNIQDNWPSANITWIIGRTEASLLTDIENVEFIVYDKRGGKAARKDLRTKLSDRQFDIALCMHASMRANLICRSIRSPVKLGFDFKRARDFQWLFTNQRIAAQDGQHVLDGMMAFARHIGAKKTELRWDVPIAGPDRELVAINIADDEPVLLISPCSSQRSRNFRNWSARNYAQVAKYAQDTYGCKVILTGGNSVLERDYGQTIVDLADANIVDLIGKTNLKELLALIEASHAVVCPDSGPAHMATTVGTPVIGLYATSNPARSGPYFNRDLTVNAYAEAVERYLGKSSDQVRWGQRVRDPGAMDLIKQETVISKIDHIFRK
ncbi:MAG: glycosyltransferase family 9 protein [Woeseiaceae bacterium]